MQESEQRGEEFFELLENPGTASEQQFEQQVRSQRERRRSRCWTAPRTSTSPGQMDDAQSAATLTLKLRRDALQVIAANIGRRHRGRRDRRRDRGDHRADGVPLRQRRHLDPGGRSGDRRGPRRRGRRGPGPPRGNFMPEGSEATSSSTRPRSSRSSPASPARRRPRGAHGLGLVQTSRSATRTWTPTITNEISSDSTEVTIEIQNQGEADESGVQIIGHRERRQPGEQDGRGDRGRGHDRGDDPADRPAPARDRGARSRSSSSRSRARRSPTTTAPPTRSSSAARTAA